MKPRKRWPEAKKGGQAPEGAAREGRANRTAERVRNNQSGRSSSAAGWAFTCGLRLLPEVRLRLKHVDRRSVERVFEVHGVVLLDHLDTGAAVLRDLIDVGAFHKAHADIGVAQAISRARFTVAVEFKIRPRKNIVEELDVIPGEYLIGGLRPLFLGSRWRFATFLLAALPLSPGFLSHRRRASEQAPINAHGARHAFAMTDATLAAHLDLQNLFTGRVVLRDRHIAVLEIEGFIRPKAGVRHEQHEVVNLFGVPFVMVMEGLARVGARRLIELLVFRRAEPRAMHHLALALIWWRQIRKVLQPAVADGGLETQPQGHDLVV